MVLVLDNYDSFTYNLVQAVLTLGRRVEVYRNDQITVRGVFRRRPSHILISPGPGSPRSAGISNAVARRSLGKVPLLGVCLGEQCMAEALGGRVVQSPRLMHGKTSPVYHDGQGVYQGLPIPFRAARYHSLIVDEKTLPDCYLASARSDQGELMGIRHKQFPAEGVQFHPESFLTEHGTEMLRNFLRLRI